MVLLLIPFTKEYFVPSLVEIDPVILEKSENLKSLRQQRRR